MALFRGTSLPTQSLRVPFSYLRQELPTLSPSLKGSFCIISVSACPIEFLPPSSFTKILPGKLLMPAGLLCNDSFARKNKFLRKAKERTPPLCSLIARGLPDVETL